MNTNLWAWVIQIVICTIVGFSSYWRGFDAGREEGKRYGFAKGIKVGRGLSQ
jgi:hypothetical protein